MPSNIHVLFLQRILVTVFTLSILTVTPFVVQATDAEDFRVREQCFATLKENVLETGILLPATITQLNGMLYPEVESNFSKNYKNLSSFGIDLNKPRTEMRVYSFGRQTGYVHPPKLPFPSSYNSDLWQSPAKEFIIAEEYAIDEASKQYFIGCAFLTIQAENLLAVTRETYAYDGPAVSLTKIDPQGNYKAWYSQNTSFNYEGTPFVDWTRLFIYPKETQNNYFDKYSVAEAFPSHDVKSFDVLKFFNQNLIVLQNSDEAGGVDIKYLVLDDNQKPTEVLLPIELSPIKPEGPDMLFPFTSYYQAIESKFPEFAKSLSLRGTLNFETYKKLIVLPELDPELEKLLIVISDPLQLARYSLDKQSKEEQGMSVSDPIMDKLLTDVKDVDVLAQLSIASSSTNETLNNDSSNKPSLKWWSLISFALLFLGILILIVIHRRNTVTKFRS